MNIYFNALTIITSMVTTTMIPVFNVVSHVPEYKPNQDRVPVASFELTQHDRIVHSHNTKGIGDSVDHDKIFASRDLERPPVTETEVETSVDETIETNTNTTLEHESIVESRFILDNLTPEQNEWVNIASEHTELSPSFLAALMSIETDFRPELFYPDRNGGTYGLFQMNRGEWKKTTGNDWLADTDNNGIPDIKDPVVHARVGAIYLQDRLEYVRKYRAKRPGLASSVLTDEQALAIAHNAGESRLKSYPNIPSITKKYLVKLEKRSEKYKVISSTTSE